MRVVVYHAGYGCDTGCCGHVVELDDDRRQFTFAHPDYDSKYQLTDEATRRFIIETVTEMFGAEHVADIDWDDCIVSLD